MATLKEISESVAAVRGLLPQTSTAQAHLDILLTQIADTIDRSARTGSPRLDTLARTLYRESW